VLVKVLPVATVMSWAHRSRSTPRSAETSWPTSSGHGTMPSWSRPGPTG